MNTGVPDGTRTMPDARHSFANFVEIADELPIDVLRNATATGLSEDVLAAFEAPFHTEIA